MMTSQAGLTVTMALSIKSYLYEDYPELKGFIKKTKIMNWSINEAHQKLRDYLQDFSASLTSDNINFQVRQQIAYYRQGLWLLCLAHDLSHHAN